MTKNVTTLDNAPASAAPKSDSSVAEAPAQAAKKLGSGDFSGQKSIVTIAASPGDGGRDAVFVSVGGVAFQIPRGKPWVVPVEVAEVLRNAVERTYHRDERTQEIIATDSPRFSFIAQDQPVAAAA